jgi:SAM-dependent methyltransferase
MLGVADTPRDRVELALAVVDREGFGLEIGASYNPIAPKAAGFRVHILDHASREELREKYRGHPGVNIDRIEEVDFVWRGELLDLLVGGREKYDYIIAAHVIEHVPDFVGFLQQFAALLKPQGVLSLVVPDMRFCFDALRWPTTTGEVLDAHFERRTRHSPGAVFDHLAFACARAHRIAWPAGDQGKLHFVHDLAAAQQGFKMAASSSDYHDIHRWRFTPASFRLLLADLNALGLVALRERFSYPTVGFEFFYTLAKGASPAIDRLALARAAHLEIASVWCYDINSAMAADFS